MPPRGNIVIVHRYNRAMIQRNPNTLFVFGDNLARRGFGGQAAEARGEPNVVGIVTKMSPSRYLTDDDVDAVRDAIVQAFHKLRNHLLAGGRVAWPADGVGTGLADLQNRAPLIALAIEGCRQHLFDFAGEVYVTDT